MAESIVKWCRHLNQDPAEEHASMATIPHWQADVWTFTFGKSIDQEFGCEDVLSLD